MAGNARRPEARLQRAALGARHRGGRQAGRPARGRCSARCWCPAPSIEPLIADPRIAAVTLTGSSEVGEHVASLAGSHLKKQVLELGGSDPFIVLADADLDAAAKTAARARNQNSGQSCIAAKRFIVEEARRGRVRREVRRGRQGAATSATRLQRETNVGPLARGDLRETLVTQVDASLKQGAQAVVGGRSLDRQGLLLRADRPRRRHARHAGVPRGDVRPRGGGHPGEGPGRGRRASPTTPSTAWARRSGRATSDRAKQLAGRIEAGAVFINGMVASDPRLPFGGVKRSGYGRELGEWGIREFTNIQTVVLSAGSGSSAAPKPAAD